MNGYTVGQLSKLFDGEFRTRQRIFTTKDKVLYVYIYGRQDKTWHKANLSEKIKSQVWGM